MSQHDRGDVLVYEESPENLQALLFDFAIDRGELRPAHRAWIRKVVSFWRTRNMSMVLLGLASRTGSYGRNMNLAKARANAVREAVSQLDPSPMPIALEIPTGEYIAQFLGVKDRTEDALFRSVYLNIYNPRLVAKPPPPPRPPVRLAKRRTWVRIQLEWKVENVPFQEASDRRADKIADAMHKGGVLAGTYQDILEQKEQLIAPTWQLAEIVVEKSSESGWAVSKWSIDELLITYRWQPSAPLCTLRKVKSSDPPRVINDAEARDWLSHPKKTYLLTKWMPL
jgi:hypothetical protein